MLMAALGGMKPGRISGSVGLELPRLLLEFTSDDIRELHKYAMLILTTSVTFLPWNFKISLPCVVHGGGARS